MAAMRYNSPDELSEIVLLTRADGEELRRFTLEGLVNGMAFSPDGGTLPGEQDVLFSPDGRLLVTWQYPAVVCLCGVLP